MESIIVWPLEDVAAVAALFQLNENIQKSIK